jgi:hypothetical protein
VTNRKPPNPANDNHRTPTEHRATVASQSTVQPQGVIRRYTESVWPQGERLYEAVRYDLIHGLNDWQRLNDTPILCVSNDNWTDDPDEPRERISFDNIMDHDSADRTVALHAKGKPWHPGEERFSRPRRNDRKKAAPGPATYRTTAENGRTFTLYQIEANAEDEVNRQIDCKIIRQRLGALCNRLLDEASSDSTTEDIAALIKQPPASTEQYIDAAIEKWILVGR